MKHNLILSLLLASTLVITGCASNQRYGDFTADGSTITQQFLTDIVDDGLQQIVELYPPAHTRLALQNTPEDPFGLSLVNALRGRGYAIITYSRNSKLTPADQNATAFGYAVDNVDDLYRVNLQVGSSTMSRAYEQVNGTCRPAGDWSRKE